MNIYKITETATGRLIARGDTVTSRLGDSGTFQMVSRPALIDPSTNVAVKSAKVIVDGREYYERVWGLTVETVQADDNASS